MYKDGSGCQHLRRGTGYISRGLTPGRGGGRRTLGAALARGCVRRGGPADWRYVSVGCWSDGGAGPQEPSIMFDVMRSFGSRSGIGAGSSFFLPTGCDAVLARHGRLLWVSSCPLCHNDNQVRRGMPFTLVKSSSLSCNVPDAESLPLYRMVLKLACVCVM